MFVALETGVNASDTSKLLDLENPMFGARFVALQGGPN